MPSAPDRPSARDDTALYGHDPTPGIVDVVPVRGRGPAEVDVYRRSGADVLASRERVYPFFFLPDPGLLSAADRNAVQVRRLRGDAFHRYVAVFDSWDAYWNGFRAAERSLQASEQPVESLYRVPSPAQQYLTQTGRTLFKGMDFDDLHRLQLDIEVLGTGGFPNASRPADEVIIVALSDNRGWQRTLHSLGSSEEALLRQTLDVVRARDPDVIEGHNIYNFDLSYLRDRCARYGIPFALGRDGSAPHTFDSSMRFAERSVDYTAFEFAGRHVVDTMFQVMSYDVFKRDLPGYGLKAAARYFGFAPEGRTYVEGDRIPEVWRDDPERLIAYAADDVTETERLARHLSGSTFYLTQMLPMPYGQVARVGPAAKIEALFVREYLRRRQSFPRSDWGSQTVGGYTDVFVTGVVGPVVYADVESLYPSIMLHYGVKPAGDELGLFRDLLERLTELRFATKRDMKAAASDEQRSSLDARQSSYKVLINCFTLDTEILTVDGPKRVGEVTVGERVYSLDPATGRAEIKPVTACYAQPYTGPVVEMRSRFVDFRVTPEHRFLAQRFTGGVYTSMAWETAQDIACDRTRRRLPALTPLPAAAPIGSRFDLAQTCDRLGLAYKTGPRGMKETRRQARWHPASFDTADWLAFLGWYASEGTLSRSIPRRYPNGNVRGETFRIRLCQKRPHRRREIADLLTRMGFSYSTSVNGLSFCSKLVYRLLEAECGRYSRQRRLPDWVFGCPPDQIQHLFDALMAGDGDAHGMRYTTQSHVLAQQVCRLALHLGIRAYVMEHDGACYRVAINPTRGVAPTLKADQRCTAPFEGHVACLTVADHHTVLAGRNGRFNWTGQSFYGNLGFGHAAFNDFGEADRVAHIGQDLLRQIIGLVRSDGGRVVEVDTDGVLFEPPPAVVGEAAERAYVNSLSARMPDGINVGFDGRFARMLSYKKKNYVLMSYDGTLKYKGSSLVSRSSERFGRQFIREAVPLLLEEDVAGLHALYLRYRDRIEQRAWPDASLFSKTETLKETLPAYERSVAEGKRPRAASYELARARAEQTGLAPRPGDRISYYIAGSDPRASAFEAARLADDWNADDPDENVAYYLRRLDEFARKFEPFFSEHDFKLVFSPEDLFGFDPAGIAILEHETAPTFEQDDAVPF